MKDFVSGYFGYDSDSEAYVRSLSPITIPMPNVKVIAYYLPQFHPLEENNKWWGNGYTEWTGVTKAVPQFVGHHQPRLPIELGFYDLRIPEVQEQQVVLAKAAGLSAFCFYFYWFSGKTVMETPIRNFADNENIDFEFCLCWANHTWTRPGKKHEVLMTQEHDAADDVAFIAHLSRYLRNKNYLRVDGKPLIMVWAASLLPNAKETAQRWRDWCEQHGIGPIHICCNQIYSRMDPAEYGMDSATQFPPGDSGWIESNIARYGGPIELLNANYRGELFDYRDLVVRAGNFVAPDYRLFRAVCPSWDNEARRPGHGLTLVGADPANYLEYLETTLDQTLQGDATEDRLVFINAWNEWAEGAHLEPDHRLGFGYLEATKMACLRAALKHDAPAEQERLAVIVHAFDPECFERSLGWLATLDLPHDVFVTVPSSLRSTLDAFAGKKNLTISAFSVEDRGGDIAPFLKVLQTIDLGRYGRVLKFCAPSHSLPGTDLTHVESLKKALAILAHHPDTGILIPDDDARPLMACSDETKSAASRLARRMGVSDIDDEAGSCVVGGICLARTAALLPLANLGILIDEFAPEKGKGTFAHAVERAIVSSAQAAGLKVAIFDPDAA